MTISTTTGFNLAPTPLNISIGYLQIEHYNIIDVNNNRDVKQYFMENWKKFLEDCIIFLISKLIKPNDLLIILNSINNNNQLTM